MLRFSQILTLIVISISVKLTYCYYTFVFSTYRSDFISVRSLDFYVLCNFLRYFGFYDFWVSLR